MSASNQLLVAERDAALLGPLKARDGAQERCLAGAGGPDERDRFGVHAERGAQLERAAR